jgi:hypothetical protein
MRLRENVSMLAENTALGKRSSLATKSLDRTTRAEFRVTRLAYNDPADSVNKFHDSMDCPMGSLG